MQENDTPATPGADNSQATETKLQRLERERMTRRAALRKLGMTSALSVFALFSVDDLARMVGKAIQQREQDNQLADTVAWELRQAGVVIAGTPNYDQTTCQDNCDASLEGKLQGQIPASNLNDFKTCVSNCEAENPTDPEALQNCIEGNCIQPEIVTSGLVIRAKAYLECCYGACDDGNNGANCKF